MNTQTNWEEDFEELCKYGDEINVTVERSKLKSFLRSKIEEAYTKGVEAVIEEIPNSNGLKPETTLNGTILKQQLKSKYLTPQKEK